MPDARLLFAVPPAASPQTAPLSTPAAYSGYFAQHRAFRKARVESKPSSERRHQIDRSYRAVHNYVLAHARPEHHHPRCARYRIARPMMLKSVAARAQIRIAPKIGKDKQCRLASIFRIALNRTPDLRAEPVRALDPLHIQRVSARVRHIDIVQRDPEQTRRQRPHQLLGDEDGKFIRTCQTERVRFEIVHRKL